MAYILILIVMGFGPRTPAVTSFELFGGAQRCAQEAEKLTKQIPNSRAYCVAKAPEAK